MTRIPMHAPPAAPAVLVADSATGGVGVLAALAALGCAAAAGVLLTGPATPPMTRIPATPVAAVSSASPTVPDPLPPRPGQPLPTARALPAAAGVPVGAPVPGWRLALDDAASAVPDLAPLPVDPAVEQAMARLRVAAAGAADSRRPGVAALTALDHAFDQVGDPYVWGATGPDTFDCSGLMLWSYRAAGVPCRACPATSSRPAASPSPSTTCCRATWSSSPPRRGIPVWSTTSACTPAAG